LDVFTKCNYKLSSLRNFHGGNKYYIHNKWTNEIFEFEKDGNGHPYIPGSSLKGAIRTIIFKKLFDELSPAKQNDLLSRINNSNPRKEFASEPLMKELFGKDPNHNLMRLLQVYDIPFSSFELSKVFILSLTNPNGTTYGWKKMGAGMPNVTLNQDPTSLIIESLPVGGKSAFSIHIDDFLSGNVVAKNTLGFNKLNLGELSIMINRYSKLKLNDEKVFFAGLKKPQFLPEVLAGIENIKSHIPKENSPMEKTEFVIRMSWGSSWKGMTGDYLSSEWLEKFRRNRNFKFTKHPDFPIYPKTRKIIFEDDIPKYLTGWVKVRINDIMINKTQKVTSANSHIDSSDWAAMLGSNFKITQNKKK
jgi:CRISPR-associated protein Csm5